MGVLLHGEPPSPKVAAKIEAFLNQPGPPPAKAGTGAPVAPTGTSSLRPPLPEPVPATLPPQNVPTAPAVPPKPREVAPPPHAARPYQPDLASDQFKARVREALHAMMCLPEYQLN